jgi:hypothetical protein
MHSYCNSLFKGQLYKQCCPDKGGFSPGHSGPYHFSPLVFDRMYSVEASCLRLNCTPIETCFVARLFPNLMESYTVHSVYMCLWFRSPRETKKKTFHRSGSIVWKFLASGRAVSAYNSGLPHRILV